MDLKFAESDETSLYVRKSSSLSVVASSAHRLVFVPRVSAIVCLESSSRQRATIICMLCLACVRKISRATQFSCVQPESETLINFVGR